MAIRIEKVESKNFKVLYGLQEVGSLWRVQARKLRIYTYGCKIFVNDTLEYEFPRAKATPWAYELESDGSVTWRIERTAQTWIDQPIKEIEKSSVGGLIFYSTDQTARLQRAGDNFTYTIKDFFYPSAPIPEQMATAGASPRTLTLATTENNVRIEGYCGSSTPELVYVNVKMTPTAGGPPYEIGKYWHPTEIGRAHV